MRRVFFVAASIIVLLFLSLDARVYKGQKEYKKKCKECHDNGQELAYSKKKREWKKLMKSNGKLLAERHLKSAKAKKSHKYFKSKKFAKKSKHLRDFFVEYAKDSGNVPACD